MAILRVGHLALEQLSKSWYNFLRKGENLKGNLTTEQIVAKIKKTLEQLWKEKLASR